MRGGHAMYITKNSQLIGKGKKFALLAPVPKHYLTTAVNEIFPIYEKVSFGTDVTVEMQRVRDLFLLARKHYGSVNVYIYVDGMAQYKAILLDEFLFYDEKKRHPNDWGSWNIEFKNYYTVANIQKCEIPLGKFRLLKTGKLVEGVRKPLRVIDPET